MLHNKRTYAFYHDYLWYVELCVVKKKFPKIVLIELIFFKLYLVTQFGDKN